MINTIDIHGGLGNQMFEYAFFLSLKKRYRFCLFIFNTKLCEHQGFELPTLFKSNIKWRKKIFTFLNVHLRWLIKSQKIVEDSSAYQYDPTVFEQGHSCYYFGCWQSEQYFKHVESEVRKAFEFNYNMLNTSSRDLLLSMNNNKKEYVSIHVRRGDYVKEGNHICSKEYYMKALMYIKTRIENVRIIVFSDDMNWVKNELKIDNAIYVDWNTKGDSWQDMCLMSKCKHNIIANSTFSWWGAWLNNNPKKIVIAPSYWIDKPTRELDIIPSDWVVL